jgi:hypothetical protein
LGGFRELSVEDDHKAETWVKFIARLMDTVYKKAKKVRWAMDNFSTHRLYFFYGHFAPEVAKAHIDRMEIIHTPVHGSWLNIAEIEFSVFTGQELDRPFASREEVVKVVEKWKSKQNEKQKKINWQFKTSDARVRLVKLYPTI